MSLSRREFLHIMSVASLAGLIPQTSSAMSSSPQKHFSAEMYQFPMKGQVRLLHLTDVHAQLNPIYYREPNVNLGMGDHYGQLPHLVGHKLLKALNIQTDTPLAHAFSFLDYQEAAQQYGKVGGFAYLKTLLDQLRGAAGGAENTLTLDGGDLWQGSGTALWTRGRDMVDASNLIGVDIMTGHWEFTYSEPEVLANINRFNGEFLAQNIRIKEDALFGDDYLNLVKQHQGTGLYSESDLLPFKPYTVRVINGQRVAIIGQAFPRTANANPQSNFPDWSFGIQEASLQKFIDQIRQTEKVAAIVLLSHNGMDVDLKMASRISGIDVILGGHTHDAMPQSNPIKTPEGGVCHVTNAGSNGKYVGCMDLEFANGRLKNLHYTLLPVFANLLKEDDSVKQFIQDLRATKYDDAVIEGRRANNRYHAERLGKTYKEILNEELAVAEETLYRRGNFMGTWDQILVNALREEHDTQISMSAGVRWGTSVLAGEAITMEKVMDQTALTYGETYRSEVTGSEIKEILEGICENLFQKDPYLQSGGDMVRVGGLDYTCEPAASLGKRISQLHLDDGTPIEAGKSYSIAGWAQVEAVGEGGLMWDVAANYLRNHRDNLTLEKINHPTLKGVRDNPGIEDYPGKLI